jgi:hypothetical protein
MKPALVVLDFKTYTARRYEPAAVGFNVLPATIGEPGADMTHWATDEGRQTIEKFRKEGKA